jgi:hypothetical protein
LETITVSGRYRALHGGRVLSSAGWRRVALDGLSVPVPPTWPIAQLGPAQTNPGICGRGVFHAPEAFVGTGGRFPSCPAPGPGAGPAVDGLWLRRDPAPGVAAQANSNRIGGPLLAVTNPELPVIELNLNGETGFARLTVGVGPDPIVARTVVASLTTKPKPPVGTAAQVPDVTGLSQEAAERIMNQAGLNVAITRTNAATDPPRIVASQSPLPGTQLPTRSTVTLMVSF